MASVSAAHMIMFIGSLVLASAVAGTVIMEVGQVSDSIETRGTSVADEIETEIAIISDASRSDAIVDDDDVQTLTVLVKNIGNAELEADSSTVDILVDSSYVSSADVTVERVDVDSTVWEPGGVVAIEIADQNVDGDTAVTVIASGNEDTIRFYWDAEDGADD
ncbi:flagellin [Natrarchaeobius halalkaliphilus]|uniref:Flagellin n=1 Tax=Natrarchaeobius halalkaliphilus TaxID=1679091 RepID=A0A3N6LXH0_9EURY|nr:flagellin [Natrarchaeobius halalkaliphilus]RQG86751.1 flagellin [Natrarchaeobius halalkaliphilus]